MTTVEYIRSIAAQATEEISNAVILMEGMLLARTDPETEAWEMKQREDGHHDHQVRQGGQSDHQ